MKWTVGKVEIIQIIEMEAGGLIQETIKNATPENIKNISWLYPNFADESGKLKAQVQSFLVKSSGKNILIDTCNGNGRSRPGSPGWGDLNTDYLQRLRKTGINESDIDIVFCTHLHFDHVGWNTKLENGKYIPTFPNAKYLFAREEYDYWKQKPEKEMLDDKMAYDESVAPIVRAGLSQIVDSNYSIDESVSLIPTPGHTPGHVSVKIKSKDKNAIISGDFVHHPCQIVHPDWTMNADTLPDIAIKTRKKILNEIVATGTLLLGSHFADPVAGYVVRIKNEFVFKT